MLDPEYTPSNTEKDLFEAKQVFMFSVFDKHLLTETIVKKFEHTTDAQSVWKEFIQSCFRKEKANSVCYLHCVGWQL